MKQIFTLASGLLFSVAAIAQTFNSPESVEYDVVNNRWFAGQNGSGVILVHSPGSGTLLPFATGCTSGPHGLEVMGSNLFACDGGRIRGFDLTTGTQTYNINVGATFLNGLTSDGSTYLFATDYSAKKIYRICPSTGTFNVMCTIIKSPNGIYYDGPNNRLVYVTWGSNAPVQAMSLADSTYSTILATTMGNCDGITRDAAGYWYVTAWTGNQLWRIDPTFSSAPVSVMSGLSSPADIDINSANDSIGIPNSGTANNVVYYTGITTNLSAYSALQETSAYPVPASEAVSVILDREVQNATLELYDATGKLIRAEMFSGNRCIVNRDNLPAGTYITVIHDLNGEIIYRRNVVFE